MNNPFAVNPKAEWDAAVRRRARLAESHRPAAGRNAKPRSALPVPPADFPQDDDIMSTQRQPALTPSLHHDAFRRALRARMERDPGLRFALVALSCYRLRRTTPDRARTVATARSYVAESRRAGFRGSVNRLLDELAAPQPPPSVPAKLEVGSRKSELAGGVR